MSMDTFRHAMNYLDDYVAIGGGEPTLHPNFWEITMTLVGACEDVWLATNGKETDVALALAKLAKKGILRVALSLDKWHAPIDPKVISAFTKTKEEKAREERKRYETVFTPDKREIRNVGSRRDFETKMEMPQKPIAAGRAKSWGRPGCSCEELFIRPDGKIYVCGCEDAPCLGNVFDGYEVSENFEHGICWHEQKETTPCNSI